MVGSAAMPGVLFLCVANSARSQLAEGLARARFGDRLLIQSAGSEPKGLNPMAIEVMRERGLDISGHTSKRADAIDPASVDVVVTLCAEEVCPAFLRPVRRVHWPIPDPAGDYPPAELRRRFRRARRQITERLAGLEASLAIPDGTSLMPASTDDRAEVEALLTASGLPLDGLDDGFPRGAVVARARGELVGVAAVETWDDNALLRSVAVVDAFRKRHLGEALVADRVAWTQAQLREDGQPAYGSISLLTTTAEAFFASRGFVTKPRGKLPPSLERSTQTQLSACSTAVAMTRMLMLDRDELFADGIASEIDAHGTMLPLWRRYPDIERYSIGWRMGSGEWYLHLWQLWFERLTPDEQAAYRARWEPDEPADWKGWFEDDELDDDAS